MLYQKYIGLNHTSTQLRLTASNNFAPVHNRYHLPVNSEINPDIQDVLGSITYVLIFKNCCVFEIQLFHNKSIDSTFRK
ncbi:MAG: hypothetical protein WCG25_09750 [bacterium]